MSMHGLGMLMWRPSLALGVGLVVLVAGLGGSASAALTGVERVAAQSPSNSSNKTVTATCPVGKRVVGAGGEIVLGVNKVVLGIVRPDPALGSVTVQGREDENGTASSWFVRAVAVCAPPPPGLERVAAASPSNSANKGVTATCPAGKRLLGTGAEIDGGGGQATANDVIPGSSLKAVTVQGLEDENGTAANWRALAYAICANPVAGLERVAATSPTDSSSNTSVQADCPAGKQVTGAGGELGGGGGEVVLDHLTPEAGLQSVRVDGFEDVDGTAANWFARAFAICAAASERVVAASSNDSDSPKEATATCPAGRQPTGGGGDVTGGGGQVPFDDLVPSGTGVNVFAFEDETGISSKWFMRAYAICATPLPGLELIANTSPGDSSDKSATATCPAGKRVVGAGGALVNGNGQVVLAAIAPDAALTSVTATGFEDQSGHFENWAVTAHAVCANPPPGLELVSAQSDPDSDPASVTATCPAGKTLLGTGALLVGGPGEVVLDDLRPNAALTSVTATGLEDVDGFGGEWVVGAHAICANP